MSERGGSADRKARGPRSAVVSGLSVAVQRRPMSTPRRPQQNPHCAIVHVHHSDMMVESHGSMMGCACCYWTCSGTTDDVHSFIKVEGDADPDF